MKRLFIYIITTLLTVAPLVAQNGRSKWASDMYDAKHQFITEELQLTPTQQKQFMPLYEQMEREI